MAFHITDPVAAGWQAIDETSTVLNHPLGTTVTAYDPVYGQGEFIYLQGVASTAVGSWVSYNVDSNMPSAGTFTTALLAANAIGPVGIAMSANVASQYGWYQIRGLAVGACLTSFADNANVWITATGGSVDDTSVAGDLVNLAKGASTTVADSGVANFEINRPYTDNASSAT